MTWEGVDDILSAFELNTYLGLTRSRTFDRTFDHDQNLPSNDEDFLLPRVENVEYDYFELFYIIREAIGLSM